MKKTSLIYVLPAIIFLIYGLTSINSFEGSHKFSDSLEAAKQYFVDKVSESIKGKEEISADSVFSVIQIMKGVCCNYCHNTCDWEKKKKKEKQISREMMKMSGQIRSMIKDIKEIESKEATINCTTCHRGETVPSTSIK